MLAAREGDGRGEPNPMTYGDGAGDVCDTCTDVDGDGLSICEGDCDDTDASVTPEAEESCNGVDDNCNGTVDDGFDWGGVEDCDDGNNDPGDGCEPDCTFVSTCGDGTLDDIASRTFLDANGDLRADMSDAVYVLRYIFRDGPRPVLGTSCVPIIGCQSVCRF